MQFSLDRRRAAARTLPAHLRVEALHAALDSAPADERSALALDLAEIAIVPDGWVRWSRSSRDPLALLIRPFALRRFRASDRACEVLVSTWGGAGSYPPEARSAILAAGAGRWRQAVKRVSLLGSDSERTSAARFIRDADDADLAPILVGLLARSSPVASVAERALLRFALRTSRARDDERTRVERVVADALATWTSHRRRGVLLAGAILLDVCETRASLAASRTPPGAHTPADASPLASWFSGPEVESHASLRSMLRRSEEPLARVRAWEWCVHDRYANACLDRLGTARSTAEHEVVLARSHLALRPRRARRLGMLRVSSGAAGFESSSLSEAARRGWARWVGGLDSGPKRVPAAREARDRAKEEALSLLLADPSPVVRHAIARAIPPGRAVDLCFDADARVARSAMLRWSLAGVERGASATLPGTSATTGDAPGVAFTRERALGRLARSPVDDVRRWAKQDQPGAWDAGDARSRLAWRRSWTNDRAGSIEAFARAIVGARSVEGVCLARSLGVVDDLVGPLAAAIGEDARLASAAAAALGESDSPAAGEALARAARSDDARVASNAIEAIERRRRRTGERAEAPALVEFKDEQRHRPRATAIRLLSLGGDEDQGEGAIDALSSMLGDDRPMHRVAGAWLAERLVSASRSSLPRAWVERWNEVLTSVGRLASNDADERVRRRAKRCAVRMLAHVRVTAAGRGDHASHASSGEGPSPGGVA